MQRGLSMDIGDGSVNPKRSPSQDSHKANLWQAQLPRLSNTSSRHCAALSKASLDLSRSQLGLQQLLDIVNELQSNETVTMCDLSHNGVPHLMLTRTPRRVIILTLLIFLRLLVLPTTKKPFYVHWFLKLFFLFLVFFGFFLIWFCAVR